MNILVRGLKVLGVGLLIILFIGSFYKPVLAENRNIGNLIGTTTKVGSIYPLAVQAINAAGTALSFGVGVVDTGTQRVTLANDDPAVSSLSILAGAITSSIMQVNVVTLPAGPSTGNALTAVGDSSSTVQIVASNTSRKGVSCRNTSTVDMFVTETVSATVAGAPFDVIPGQTWTEPYGFTGAINAIWSSDPNTGSAVCQEVQ